MPFQNVIACRDIADPQQRLSCFDEKVAALSAAAIAGDLAVADKAQIAETKKELFGFSTANVKLFGNTDKTDSFVQIEDVVTAAEALRGGQWQITLSNGAVWQQVDTALVAVDPKAGTKITIRRASMGSFLARIGGQPGIRMRRVR